jgi:hypothetical protein
MKKISIKSNTTLILLMLLSSTFLTKCNNKEDSYNYPFGVFPDTVINIVGLNTAFDDYNSTTSAISGLLPLIFSSNRRSSGGQFDLEQGILKFTFDKNDGHFDLNSEMLIDPFLTQLISKSETPLNDFGPYRTYSSYDGMEYFVLASENADGNLDLKYCTNIPPYGTIAPEIYGPYPVKLLNTDFDDAYLTFDLNLDTAYFISNPEGHFDIYSKSRPAGKDIGAWFNSDFSASEKVNSLNSSSDDKCPMVYNKLMVFTSNRPGGYGGFDLYYSNFSAGNWGAPVNFGPRINSSSDEYRPLIGYHSDFSNIYMIFSSNRPGGNGGFDLYFTGLDTPQK